MIPSLPNSKASYGHFSFDAGMDIKRVIMESKIIKEVQDEIQKLRDLKQNLLYSCGKANTYNVFDICLSIDFLLIPLYAWILSKNQTNYPMEEYLRKSVIRFSDNPEKILRTINLRLSALRTKTSCLLGSYNHILGLCYPSY